jgi:hypothetical protein
MSRIGTGAGLRTVVTPARRAVSNASATQSSGTSREPTTTCAQPTSSRRARTPSTVSRRLAPGATPIWFLPSASTKISAVPVVASAVDARPATPTPSRSSASRTPAPAASDPTQPMRRTVAPSRRAATA